MRQVNDEMQKFLVSSVFGYDLNTDDKDEKNLKEACIGRAYLDLARVIPYKYSSGYVDNHKGIKEVTDFLNAKKVFKENIKKILIAIKPGDEPSSKIRDVVDKAEENENAVFKKGEKFTYGMAQKWVNMYLKYLWLFSAEDCKKRTEYDMPIDSYIIDALWRNKTLTIDKCAVDKSKRLKNIIKDNWQGRITERGRASGHIKVWSQWTEEEYKAVQELIKNEAKEKHILTWENELWMDQAAFLRQKNQ